ncbi:MAG TPA: TlpA disulfide reductase family protein [Verrucomicrobiae bacterium]|jgi:thiol-disulfide isomerase/thioredoxin
MKLTLFFSTICLLMLPVMAGASEPVTNSMANTKLTPNENRMWELRKEVDSAETAYLKSSHGKDGDELWTHFCETNDANLPKIFELAKLEPQSETALDMFEWILKNRRISMQTLRTNALQSIELLGAYHAANPNITNLCRILGNFQDSTYQPILNFLQKVADKNPNREARGQATLALVRLTKQNASILAQWESETNSTNPWYAQRMAFILAEEKNGGAQAASLAAENYCRSVLSQYADCPSLQPANAVQPKATLGELAAIELFELEHLTVGKAAPELEGETIDGKKLRLSDYRGKVVVLSFWASWCGPCMQMVPAEVRLAQQMQGKPFALIGINGDSNRSDAQNAVKKEQMSWPSFWDEKGAGGIIPTAWNIHGWPTVFILDSAGVIQFKFVGYGNSTENLLNQKVNSLLDQLKNKTQP